MNIALIIILSFIGISILVGAYIFFFKNKNNKQFPFILYSADMIHRQVIYPKLKIDPLNHAQKKFFFEEHKESLEIKPPTAWIDGKSYREITYNDKGEFSYLEGLKVNKDKYLEISISPEEKTIALARYKEHYERYKENMNKYQAYTMIGGFILVFLIAIGVIYSTIAYVNVSSNMVELEKQNVKYKELESGNINAMNEIVKQLVIISGKNSGGEIVRPLS